MLNPLNIAPASGQITDPKPDPLTSPKSDAPETKRGDKTFESVLADESGRPHRPEDANKTEAQTDVDPRLDVVETDESGTDEAGSDDIDIVAADTDEVADFPSLTDNAAPPPDADETIWPLDADIDAPVPVDAVGLIAGQDRLPPNEFIGPDTQAGPQDGRNDGRIFARITGGRAVSDKIIADRVGPTSDNTGPLLTTAQSPQPLVDQASETPNQTVLTEEITADLPQVPSDLRGAADDKSPLAGGRAVHSLLGVALGQQASVARAGQNEVQKKPQVTAPMMQTGTDQALPDKAVDVLSNTASAPATPTAPATAEGAGQINFALQALAKGGRTYKDSDKTTAHQKNKPRETGLNMTGRSSQIPPAPSGVAAATTTGPALAPTPATFEELQMDTGRVNWVSETGVLGDTSTRSGLPAPVTGTINQVFNHPDLPRHLAAQIASVAQRGAADKPVELLLNPSELGRVKISMTSNDGRMSVSVIADRPETLDLMRRHIDVLAQEFLDIGYGQADFAFGQNSPQNGAESAPYPPDNRPQMPGLAGETAPETPPVATAALAARLITDRVDIRL